MICIPMCYNSPRRRHFVLSAIVILFLFCVLFQNNVDSYISHLKVRTGPKQASGLLSSKDNVTNCHHSHDMDDIFVILKTGATEALEKVPVHMETALRCLPHYAIFSDYEEEIAGVHTHDVLRSISGKRKSTDPDFGLYNRLHTLGRPGLLTEDWKDEENGPFGKPGNPGWKLDKWKFIPMMDEALQLRPNARWYVFIEADTYVVWANLIAWLSRLDHTKPYYLGAPMRSGEVFFAYGGSAIVLSNVAIQQVSKYRVEHPAEVEEMIADGWAGDCVLGKVIHALSIPFIWSWPMLQTARVWEFNHFLEDYQRKPWCYPAVSYHHMTPEDIRAMWRLEQQWSADGENSVMLHRDVFNRLIYNETRFEKNNWDNLSHEAPDDNNSDIIASFEDCARQCARVPQCLQFSLENSKCLTSKTVTSGVSREGVHSGWMNSRIKAFLENVEPCSEAKYIVE